MERNAAAFSYTSSGLAHHQCCCAQTPASRALPLPPPLPGEALSRLPRRARPCLGVHAPRLHQPHSCTTREGDGEHPTHARCARPAHPLCPHREWRRRPPPAAARPPLSTLEPPSTAHSVQPRRGSCGEGARIARLPPQEGTEKVGGRHPHRHRRARVAGTKGSAHRRGGGGAAATDGARWRRRLHSRCRR